MVSLNSEQEKAANILEGNLLIIASAGTGKTTTIVERYINLLDKKKLKPHEIMMTTFTNKAAKDMVKKIEKKTTKISPFIGTMHSLFLRILRENPRLAFKGKNYTIITESAEQKKIIREILESEEMSKRSDAVSYFLRWIGKFKNRGILAEDLNWEGGIDEAKETGLIPEMLDDEIIYVDPLWRGKVNLIYKKYQEYLHAHSLLDFDEILILTYRLFEENPSLLNEYKTQFKSIMVDEAQDLNVIQVKILDQLKNNNLCLIGDDCQNIYEWRGSSNDLIFNFEENEEKIYLEKNYRSTDNIIKAVNKTIESMDNKLDKRLVSTRDPLEHIEIKGFRKSEEETEWVVDKVERLIESGEAKEEIAILFRTNMIGKSLEREFRRKGIPCHLAKSAGFFDREEIRDLLSFLKLVINPDSQMDFERIIGLVKGLGKVKLKKIMQRAQKENISFVTAIEDLSSYDFVQEINMRLTLLHRTLISEDPLNAFLKDFEYIEYLEDKYEIEQRKFNDKLENIQVFIDLFDQAKEEEKNVLDFLDSLIDIEKKEKTEDKVVLSTIHGAKGLEWKHVFVISCNEKTLPFYKDELTKSKRDSELRLFYVAISRAKDNLVLTYSRFQGFKYAEPSQFLEIIYDFGFTPGGY
ncbi:MAG: ATP-dependent helicase [Nanoarchaeota archaeon]|jgi:DNA helicase-2/ATP-dependent DNA helicase PcrA|nr:ATP-dependent helicase [Nanoarchaeota archaeon]